MRSFRMPFLPGRRGLRTSLAVLLALGLAAAAAAAPRIVAVGDVHGDLAAFRRILAEAGVVDTSGAWVGGDTVLVQVGDLIDRGPNMRGTLDFVMGLEPLAAKRGGTVVALLGNHEVLNMAGDLRYVTAANYAEFADAGSEKRREDAWIRVRELRERRARQLGQPEPPGGPDARKAWMDTHPPGYIEHAEAFGPDGRYGRWLRARPAIFVAQDTAFLHGGLSPALAGVSLEEINQRVREDLKTLDSDRALFVSEGLILPFFDVQETFRAVREELDTLATSAKDAERRKTYEHFLDWGSWTMNSADGPLWFRGYARWSDAEGDAEMPGLRIGGRRRALRRRAHRPGGRAHPGPVRRLGLPHRHRNARLLLAARPALGARDRGQHCQRHLPGRTAPGALAGAAGRRENGAGRSRPRGRVAGSVSLKSPRHLPNSIARLLNLQRGDGRRGALLFTYLFLIITCYQLGKTTRDSLFLSVFKASKLPYADIAIALSVGVVDGGLHDDRPPHEGPRPHGRQPAGLRGRAVRLLVPRAVPPGADGGSTPSSTSRSESWACSRRRRCGRSRTIS